LCWLLLIPCDSLAHTLLAKKELKFKACFTGMFRLCTPV
jgi:hypothetical protein